MLGFMLAIEPITIGMIVMAALAAGTAVYSGEKTASAAKKGRRMQEKMQHDSIARAERDDKVAAMGERRANKKKPEMNTLLFAEKQKGGAGPASTLLAGKTGGKSLLGGGGLLG